MEYDGTNYRTEGQEPIDQESKLNYGFVYPWSKNFIQNYSFQGEIL